MIEKAAAHKSWNKPAAQTVPSNCERELNEKKKKEEEEVEQVIALPSLTADDTCPCNNVSSRYCYNSRLDRNEMIEENLLFTKPFQFHVLFSNRVVPCIRTLNFVF